MIQIKGTLTHLIIEWMYNDDKSSKSFAVISRKGSLYPSIYCVSALQSFLPLKKYLRYAIG